MIGRFGVETFRDGMSDLLDYAEEQARHLIRRIPDGEYFFADYMDEDSAGGYPARIALNLAVDGDELVFDYRGSDPQLASSINVPTGGDERHVLKRAGQGEVFGEMALFDDSPRSATVVATRPSCLLSLRGERLKELILDMPEISFELMRVLTGRVRTVEQRLAELSPADAGEAPPAPAPPAAVKT